MITDLSSSKMGFLANVALNDPTPGKRVHSMTSPSEQLKEILSISLKKISPRHKKLKTSLKKSNLNKKSNV